VSTAIGRHAGAGATAVLRLAVLAAAVVAVHGEAVRLAAENLDVPLVSLPTLGPVVLALLVAAATQRLHGDELPIHDRQTDVIVGISLAAIGIVASQLLVTRLDDARWMLRLDLLGLPLFVAGLTTLLFGARPAWRMRWTYAALATIGPSLMLATAIGARGLLIGLATTGAVGLVGLARSHGRGRSRAGARRLAVARVGRGWVAVAMLVAAALALQLRSHAGAPHTTATTRPASVGALPAGWRVLAHHAVKPSRPYADLTWSRTVLTGPPIAADMSGARQAAVDVLGSASILRLAALPDAALYRFDGVRAAGGSAIALADGVTGQVRVWQRPTAPPLTTTVVDFTLAPRRGGYQRVVILVLDKRELDPAALPQPAAAGWRAIGAALGDIVRGTPNERFVGHLLAPKNIVLAADFADAVILAAGPRR
jgi:hypothetical protein